MREVRRLAVSRGLHAGGRVDAVSKEAVPGHGGAHNPRRTGTRVYADPRPQGLRGKVRDLEGLDAAK